MAKFKESFIQNFASFVYEDVCREKMWELSSQGKTLFFEKVGRYWGSKVGEIDIVAIGNEEKNLILGECKYTKKRERVGIAAYFTRKNACDCIFDGSEKRTIYYFQHGGIYKRIT